MRKLKLSLDDLELEAFDPDTKAADQRGTVHGHVTQAYEFTCNGYDTCYPNDTCDGCNSDFSVLTDCHRC